MYDHINDHITVSMDLILNYKTYSVISVSSSSYFRLEWQRTLFYTCMLNKLNQLMVLRTSLSLIRIISCVGAAPLHDEFTSRLLPNMWGRQHYIPPTYEKSIEPGLTAV